jgi:hypothetical protein
MLVKASELFRASSGQLFTPGESTVRMKVNGGDVRLAQSPVISVESVTDDCGTAVEFVRHGQVLTVHRRSHEFVRVHYTHGATEVPEIVRVTVAEIVARVLKVDPRATVGMAQFSKGTGPFTESGTFATWAVGGQVMLSPEDVNTAKLFRAPRSSHMIVQRP